jgi:N-acetylglucosamine kinase-like BadF-type ATPase
VILFSAEVHKFIGMTFRLAVTGHVPKSSALLITDDSEVHHADGPGMEWRERFAGAPDLAIEKLIERLELNSGLPTRLGGQLNTVAVAVAGIDSRYDVDRLKRLVGRIAPVATPIVASLAEAAHVGAFLGGPGVLIRSGHGSSVYVKGTTGECRLVGGWGGIVGDPGSGYWIGRQTLIAATRTIDGIADRAEQSFVQEVLTRERLAKPVLLMERLEESRSLEGEFGSRRYLHALGITALKVADFGNSFAELLVVRAHTSLIEAARAAVKGLFPPKVGIPLCFSGSIFRKSLLFKNLLLDRLSRELKSLEFIESFGSRRFSSLVGMGLISLGWRQASEISTRGQVFLARVEGYDWAKHKERDEAP